MDDVWYHIMDKLSLKEKIRLEIVCKRWRNILRSQFHSIEILDTADYLQDVPANMLVPFLMALLDRCSKRVRCFRFRKYRSLQIEEKLLQKLFTTCTSLKTFEAKNVFITHKALSVFDQIPRDLQEFRLKYCLLDTKTPEITRYVIKKMLHQCSSLREFVIVGIGSCHGYLVIDDDLLMELPKSIENLVTSAGDSLKLHTVEFSKKLTKLKAFDAQNSPLPNASLYQIAKNCSSLVHLNISFSVHISDFSPVLLLKNLSNLQLKGTQLNDRYLTLIIGNCKRLEHLNISTCIRLSETGLVILKNCKTLKRLDVSVVNAVSNMVLFLIASNCALLEQINFSYCPKVTLDGIKCLSLLPNLQKVIGDGIKISPRQDSYTQGTVQQNPANRYWAERSL